MTNTILSAQKLHKTYWNFPNMLVLNIGTSAIMQRNLIRRHKELMETMTSEPCPFMLYRHIPKFGAYPPLPPTGSLLNDPWKRAGYSPFDLSKV